MAEPAAHSLDSDWFTVDEFHARIADGQKADLIDGVIYVASPDTRRNDLRGNFLLTVLTMYCDLKDLGETTGNRYAYRLSEHRAPEPDLAFVSAARVSQVITDREGIGPPDVAVEIVSRDSRQRDYQEKLELYRSSGVREYWIVDPIQMRCEFYRLEKGAYQLVPLEENRIFRSQAVPGCWLDVSWLVGARVPKPSQCLQQILEGS